MIEESEAWLFYNPQALAAVRRGLVQARQGIVVKNPPDLKAAAKLAKQLEDLRSWHDGLRSMHSEPHAQCLANLLVLWPKEG